MKKAFSLIELSIVLLIIGIVLAGVTQGSRLLVQMRLATARSMTESSPVASIKGLSVWYETTSKDSFIDSETEDESAISVWRDINPQATRKIDMPQSVPENRPFYDQGAINNLPALRFNGEDRYFEQSYFAELNPSQFTIFFVAKTPSTSSLGTIFSARSTDSSVLRGYIVYAHQAVTATPPSAYTVWTGNGTDWGLESYTPADIILNRAQIVSFTYNGSSIATYSDGVLKGSRSETNFLPNLTNNFRIGAGVNEDEPLFFFNGHIGELIIFDRALKSEERSSVEKYLGQKWGVRVD